MSIIYVLILMMLSIVLMYLNFYLSSFSDDVLINSKFRFLYKIFDFLSTTLHELCHFTLAIFQKVKVNSFSLRSSINEDGYQTKGFVEVNVDEDDFKDNLKVAVISLAPVLMGFLVFMLFNTTDVNSLDISDLTLSNITELVKQVFLNNPFILLLILMIMSSTFTLSDVDIKASVESFFNSPIQFLAQITIALVVSTLFTAFNINSEIFLMVGIIAYLLYCFINHYLISKVLFLVFTIALSPFLLKFLILFLAFNLTMTIVSIISLALIFGVSFGFKMLMNVRNNGDVEFEDDEY